MTAFRKFLFLFLLIMCWVGRAKGVCGATDMTTLRACVASGSLDVGDTITVTPGDYYTAGTPLDLPAIPNGTCDGTHKVWIKSSVPADIPAADTRITRTQAAAFPHLYNDLFGASVIRVLYGANTGCWKFEGLKIEYTGTYDGTEVINVGTDTSNENTATEAYLPNYIDFFHVLITCATDCHRGIKGEGRNIRVRDSIIDKITSLGQQSAGYGAVNTTGPVEIQNNEIVASGENIIFGGTDPIIGLSTRVGNVRIRYNYLHKLASWQSNSPADYQNCNLLEFKNAEHVLIEYNDLDTSFSDCQSGGGLLLTTLNDTGHCVDCTINDVVARYNVIHHVGQAIILAGSIGYSRLDHSSCLGPGPAIDTTDAYVTSTGLKVFSASGNFGEGDTVGLHVTFSGGTASVSSTTRLVTAIGDFNFGSPFGSGGAYRSITVDGANLPVGTGMTMTFESHTTYSTSVHCSFATPMTNVSISQTLIYDVAYALNGNAWGCFQLGAYPMYDVTIDHVTCDTEKDTYMEFPDLSVVTGTGLTIKNSIFSGATYGLFSSSGCCKALLDAWYPGGYTFSTNVVSPNGSTYPSLTTQLTQAALHAEFTDLTPGSENYQLKVGSVYRLAALDGEDIGVSDWTNVNIAKGVIADGYTIGGGGDPDPDPDPAPPVRFPIRVACADLSPIGNHIIEQGTRTIAFCAPPEEAKWATRVDGRKRNVTYKTDGKVYDDGLRFFSAKSSFIKIGTHTLTIRPMLGSREVGPTPIPFSVTVTAPPPKPRKPTR